MRIRKAILFGFIGISKIIDCLMLKLDTVVLFANLNISSLKKNKLALL